MNKVSPALKSFLGNPHEDTVPWAARQTDPVLPASAGADRQSVLQTHIKGGGLLLARRLRRIWPDRKREHSSRGP